MRRTLMLAVIAVVVAGGAEAGPSPKGAPGHLRSLSAASEALAVLAAERSPGVRRLVEDLERSDVVVYLEVLVSPQVGVYRASMRFVAWTGGTRYLLVQIDGYRLLPTEQVPLLGHELSHALEVAAAPEVRDTPSFKALYKRIGTEWGTHFFETANARATEQRVREEVGERPRG